MANDFAQLGRALDKAIADAVKDRVAEVQKGAADAAVDAIARARRGAGFAPAGAGGAATMRVREGAKPTVTMDGNDIVITDRQPTRRINLGGVALKAPDGVMALAAEAAIQHINSGKV